MGTVGDAYDNAMAESFFSLLESELLQRRVFKTKADASMALFTYVEAWYNRVRRHGALGQLSPLAFEQKFAATEAVESKTKTIDHSRQNIDNRLSTGLNNAILIAMQSS